MQRVSLTAENRGDTKGHNGPLRVKGLIPAVIYGIGIKGSRTIQIPEKDFVLLSRKGLPTLLFDLDIEGEHKTALVKDYQKHIITKKVHHVDFYAVDLNQPIEVEIPVKLVGDAKGVKIGGRLEQYLYTIKVKALPEIIPHELTIDITNYDLGSHIHVKDITPPKKIEFSTSPESTVLTIRTPRAVTEEKPAEAAATTATTPTTAAPTTATTAPTKAAPTTTPTKAAPEEKKTTAKPAKTKKKSRS